MQVRVPIDVLAWCARRRAGGFSDREGVAYLEVISKVVPKIWARMNSAIVKYVQNGNADAKREKEQSRQGSRMGVVEAIHDIKARQRIAVCWK